MGARVLPSKAKGLDVPITRLGIYSRDPIICIGNGEGVSVSGDGERFHLGHLRVLGITAAFTTTAEARVEDTAHEEEEEEGCKEDYGYQGAGGQTGSDVVGGFYRCATGCHIDNVQHKCEPFLVVRYDDKVGNTGI